MPSISIKGRMLAYLLLIVLLSQVSTLITNVSPVAEDSLDLNFDIKHAFLTTPIDSNLSLTTLINNPDYLTVAPPEAIPWRFEPQIYWLRFTLKNNTDEERTLHATFNNLMLDDLHVLQVENSEVINSIELGWDNQNLTPIQRSTPSFRFNIKAQNTTQLFARISTDGITKTNINFLEDHQFIQHVKNTHLIYGVLVGIMVMIALYNLILFFVIHDKLYLIYIGYILSILMMSGVVIGFGHYIWSEAIMAVFRRNIVSLNFFATIFSLLFAIFFLKYHLDNDKYYKVGILYTAIMILGSVVSLFLPEHISAPLFFTLMIGLYVLCIILITRKAIADFYWTKFYIISWLPLLIGAAIQPLELVGTIPSTFHSHYAFSFGVVFEITLMAMALAERMRAQKELALYNATHNLNSNLPNQNLLSTRLQDQIRHRKDGYLCLLKIVKYQTLSAYISSEESHRITKYIQQKSSQKLATTSEFITIEKRKSKSIKIAQLTEDTFAIISNSTLKNDHLKAYIEELMDSICETLNVSGFSVNLASQCGITRFTKQDQQAEAIIKRAYQAIEQSQRSGKVIQFYRERDSINQSQKLSLASDLQSAIRNGELELYHQPQIDLSTREVIGSEVLVRWRHRTHGMILPEEFIPIAEDMGIINELTQWVLKTACQQLRDLANQGIIHHRISVNISGKDISSPQFLSDVSNLLAQTKTPPQRLTFELTESVMVDSFQDVNNTMKTLSNLGIHFSIDDYGTGYSSLSYISQMAFTALKIDKSFIQDMDNDAKNFTIVKTTLDMAQALNLKVVAEGIECPRIEQLLIDCGCGIGQGFFYSPPLAFGEYGQWLREYQSHQRHLNITAI
jgi:EAL domain-containing protein (putative c-di-GMP-specific phosphodiesterase class I)/GGDEF domain-containing protein